MKSPLAAGGSSNLWGDAPAVDRVGIKSRFKFGKQVVGAREAVVPKASQGSRLEQSPL
jgi:hypothetical protein